LKKWENVARGISMVCILTFLPSYLEKIGISFWLIGLCIFAAVYCVFFILSKIEFLQKSVSNKAGWLIFLAASIIITVLFDFILNMQLLIQ
jgi:hypothetical protein